MGGLRRTEYDFTKDNTHDAGQEIVESDHRWAADAFDGIAWDMKKKIKKVKQVRDRVFIVLIEQKKLMDYWPKGLVIILYRASFSLMPCR